LPEGFIGYPIGDRALVRHFINEVSSRASCSVLSWVVEYVDLLRRNVWLDVCTRKNEVSTHGGWWGSLGMGGDILINPGIVVDNVIAMLMQCGMIIGHIIGAHVNIPQVLWLTLCSDVFDGWGHALPVLA
jgi:hypothetical protein